MKRIKYIILTAILMSSPTAMAQWGTGFNNAQRSDLPSGTIANIVMYFMNWILGIVGLIGVIGFAIAGILYLTAAGDDTQITRAKTAMTWSIVGVVVALLGVVIIQAVDSMLGGTRADF